MSVGIQSLGFKSSGWMRAWLIASLLCCVSVASAQSNRGDDGTMPDAPMHEQIIKIPTNDQRPVMLQATVFTPSGKGPFPLLVMNHGADGDIPTRQQPRYSKTFSAYYFLSRGYAVVLPMMRGYAGSEGEPDYRSCDFVKFGIKNAIDIQAVIQYMAAQPNIDGSNVVVAGQSFGGWNTLAVGTLNMPNVKGLINYSGGLGASACPNSIDDMVDAAGYYGARTKTPSIWFYGSNDKIFSESTWRAAYRRYTLMGGSAELVAYGNFMDNAHNLLGYPEGLAIWADKVDAYLAKVGMPHQLRYPEYLPIARPPATRFADLNDVNAVPYLREEGRQHYREFLKKPFPRVLVISDSGGLSISSGGFDPLGMALKNCQKQGMNCGVYAIDNDVVWVPPVVTPLPRPMRFAALENVSAIPYIDEKGQQSYQQFLKTAPPRAFLITEDGSAIFTDGGADPLGRALDACKKIPKTCIPYAVNNDVVYVKPAPLLPPTHFAAVDDIAAVPYLNDQGRDGYRKFLTLKHPRAFVLAANGWSISAGGEGRTALDNALASCAKTNPDCRPYALDDEVVWVNVKKK